MNRAIMSTVAVIAVNERHDKADAVVSLGYYIRQVFKGGGKASN